MKVLQEKESVSQGEGQRREGGGREEEEGISLLCKLMTEIDEIFPSR